RVKVEIINRTKGEIYLAGSLDASDCAWRYPHCYFEITGPDGRPAAKPIGRCGNMNALRQHDFARVPSGGKFNPYQHTDDPGFFFAHQLRPENFQAPGDYRIRFVYSTDKTDIRYWLGDGRWMSDGPAKEKLQKLLDRVPKGTVKSNEIVVSVASAKVP